MNYLTMALKLIPSILNLIALALPATREYKKAYEQNVATLEAGTAIYNMLEAARSEASAGGTDITRDELMGILNRAMMFMTDTKARIKNES
jgi:hypothetical protein